MAITTNLIMQQFSGTLGKQVVFKKYHDKVVVSMLPDMSRRVLSEKQIAANNMLKLANSYAKSQYYKEDLKNAARLRLKVPFHKSLFHALVKEYMDLHKNQPEATGK